MAKTEKTLEASFQKLDGIIEKLENQETSLDNSFKLYHQGIELLKTCNESIDKVEKQIIILNESGESNEL